MAGIFRFFGRSYKRGLFLEGTVQLPVEIIVAIGRYKAVGIGVMGDTIEVVERPVFFFLRKIEAEDIAKELLQRLGVPVSEWEKILSTKREIGSS